MPSLDIFRPTHFIDSVANVDPAQFIEENPEVKAITYDLDGTLIDYHGLYAPEEHVVVLEGFNALGIWQGFLSNAKKASRSQRVEEIAAAMSSSINGKITPITSFMVGGERKPKTAMYDYAARISGYEPGQMAHVGDQIVKDVLGANRAGFAASILVARYGEGDDSRVKYIQRPIEAGLVRPIAGPRRVMRNFPPTLTPVKRAA